MNVATQRSGTDLAFPTQRFSEYTGQRNINPLLRNVYKQNACIRNAYVFVLLDGTYAVFVLIWLPYLHYAISVIGLVFVDWSHK
jgi:hypothetical protein